MVKTTRHTFTLICLLIILTSLYVFEVSQPDTVEPSETLDPQYSLNTSMTSPEKDAAKLRKQFSTTTLPLTSATAIQEFTYIEVIDSCGPFFEGTCVNLRSGPSKESSVIEHLRTGVVLQVDEPLTHNNETWYKITIDKEIPFPERVTSDWYVADGNYIRVFRHKGVEEVPLNSHSTSTKHILVDLSEQMLYAYEGTTLFMEERISTGLKTTPTPRGTFTIYRKTPSRYMQGPTPYIESDQVYDLPGVPWNLYFTKEGAVIHGAYWHNHFGQLWSHGCVNLPQKKAKKLYEWADIGMTVTVQD